MPAENLISFTSHKILILNTLAFTVCFSAWMLNGVLVTFLTDNGFFDWTMVEIGWLLGVPVLTGSVFRLPIGILTDRIGGKWVFGGLLLFCAVPMFLLSRANSYSTFLFLSFLFGMAGTSFAVGVGFTSVWYPKSWQGRAIGIFGMGTAGASLTTLIGPSLLNSLTAGGANPEGWRLFPIIYAVALFIMALLFLFFAENKKPVAAGKSLRSVFRPLTEIRVWRFGLYYFLLFGCFVAFSQWLVPYFVNVYQTDLVLAGLFASSFSLPAGLFRAIGGFLSDKYGARRVMYGVLGCSVVLSFFLIIPRMSISSPGLGVMATSAGTVTAVSGNVITVNGKAYPITAKSYAFEKVNRKAMVFPAKESWHEVLVKPGDKVVKKQLLAQGTTRIYFQANMWVFIGLIMLIGMSWGIGTAAVFKHIPEYFPAQIGLVGGMVGLIGGLGGFVGPILFGYLLTTTGLWTSSWMFVWLLSVGCIVWMHLTITRIMNRRAPDLADKFEHPH
jgi:MFS transporter, NNP family, nitrate/nitrite transporter